MHVIFRESHGLEDAAAPQDLGQDPAELVVLSFSDSDLGAFAAGWRRAAGSLPELRLANLAALRHPLSVDTYLERTVAGARGVLVRLIGGEPYWSYGLLQLQDLARRRGIALAVLPGDADHTFKARIGPDRLRERGHLDCFRTCAEDGHYLHGCISSVEYTYRLSFFRQDCKLSRPDAAIWPITSRKASSSPMLTRSDPGGSDAWDNGPPGSARARIGRAALR